MSITKVKIDNPFNRIVFASKDEWMEDSAYYRTPQNEDDTKVAISELREEGYKIFYVFDRSYVIDDILNEIRARQDEKNIKDIEWMVRGD